jgi:hypothetical protein
MIRAINAANDQLFTFDVKFQAEKVVFRIPLLSKD